MSKWPLPQQQLTRPKNRGSEQSRGESLALVEFAQCLAGDAAAVPFDARFLWRLVVFWTFCEHVSIRERALADVFGLCVQGL